MQSVELWDQVFQARYCGGCADVIHAEHEQAEQARLTRDRLESSGVSPRQLRFTWDAAARADVGQAWLEDYRAATATNLLLFGTVGAGKTALASLIVRDLCESGTGAWLVNFRNLLSDIRASFGTNTTTPWMERAYRTPVLALDDVGAEQPTAWARDQLATIIERRYERGAPIIVTSNYTPAELARRLGHDDPVVGQRIVSRLTENARQYEFEGTDRRAAA